MTSGSSHNVLRIRGATARRGPAALLGLDPVGGFLPKPLPMLIVPALEHAEEFGRATHEFDGSTWRTGPNVAPVITREFASRTGWDVRGTGISTDLGRNNGCANLKDSELEDWLKEENMNEGDKMGCPMSEVSNQIRQNNDFSGVPIPADDALGFIEYFADSAMVIDPCNQRGSILGDQTTWDVNLEIITKDKLKLLSTLELNNG
ncbi:hypothetical protein B0H10DRAFT_1944723 [Mycena sp. CBHHK59/15]|nr:hypothetical protein B0H10DRAFT_1944723 [Mycena sp. CBHHK59/15]